jgi:Zn-dependent peptidase ImmA (M78 family)
MSKELTGVRADHKYSYSNLERLAAYVRQQLKLPPDQAIDPLQLFEDLHEITIRQANGKEIPLRSGVIALEDSEGYTRYDQESGTIEILAAETTYRHLEERHPRAAYFVAHELGHCLLHTDQLIRLAQMPTNQQAAFHRGREGHKVYEDTEWQANAFASALLMPASGIAALERACGKITAPLIADRFGVSSEAAGYRLDLYAHRKTELLI